MDKPIIYNSRPKLNRNIKFIDAYSPALSELFKVSFPKEKNSENSKAKLGLFLKNRKIADCWIYYPKEKTLIRSLREKDYLALRTARNKNLITAAEQANFRNLNIGIAGLSVGSAILNSLAISGGPKYLRIADFDVLEITNLNRIRASYADVGKNKTQIAAEEIYKIDPFANIKTYPEGLNEKNILNFLLKPKKLSAFIDEMDDLHLKFYARQLCKKHKIPVIMATDNGDTAIIDLERFDLEPKRKLFHGLAENIDAKNLKSLSYAEWLKVANKIIGRKELTQRMKDSVSQAGKTIAGVPQLGTTAQVAGSGVSLILRRMASGQKMPSGRYRISLESAFKI